MLHMLAIPLTYTIIMCCKPDMWGEGFLCLNVTVIYIRTRLAIFMILFS